MGIASDDATEAVMWLKGQDKAEPLKVPSEEKEYVVFAEEPDLGIQESLVQQTNKLTLEMAKAYKPLQGQTGYIYKYVGRCVNKSKK